MKLKYAGSVLIMIIMCVLMTACGPGEKKSTGGKGDKKEFKFPIETSNNGKAVSGGTLKVAMVKDSPIVGIFNFAMYKDGYDGDILDWFVGGYILDVDENFEVTDTGMATLTVDVPNKKTTIKIKDNMKWSDGQPLVADDIIYAYEVIGSKDYAGVRYDDESTKIVGMEEYHTGKAPNISGIKKVDDKTVEITFKQLGQGIYTASTNGLLRYALPKHYLKDVPIKDLEKSDKIRKNIVTVGPYTISNSVQGESLELKANEYYFRGKPKIEKVILQVVNSQTIGAAMKAGEYDIAFNIPTDLYKTYKDFDNLEVLGRQELYYSYLGFKMGHFDKAKGENVVDPDKKMSDLRLRQALAYGINTEEMVNAFYEGLREKATSSVPPVFKKYYPKDFKGFEYNPEKAKKLLDEAGYKDVDGDGYREDKNGKPLEIKIAAMSGGDTAEPLAQYYIQQWKQIGIKGVLATGRLIEFNSFYDKVEADDPEIDVYFAAWGVGTDPNPYGTAGRKAMFNYTRFVSEENDKLMAEIASPKTLEDPNYKAEALKKWQEYYINQAVIVPLTYRYQLYPVNKRVKNFYVGYDAEKLGKTIHLVELTADAPIKAKN